MISVLKGDIVYYAQAMPEVDVYNLLELKIRTVEDGWFVGTEKSYQAYLFNDYDYDVIVYHDRDKALKVIKEAEKHRKKITKDDISSDIENMIMNNK